MAGYRRARNQYVTLKGPADNNYCVLLQYNKPSTEEYTGNWNAPIPCSLAKDMLKRDNFYSLELVLAVLLDHIPDLIDAA